MAHAAQLAPPRAHGQRPVEADALVAGRQMEALLQGVRGVEGPEFAVGNGGSPQAQHRRAHPAAQLGEGVAALDTAVALQVEAGEVLGQSAQGFAGAVRFGEHTGDLGLGVPVVAIDQRPPEQVLVVGAGAEQPQDLAAEILGRLAAFVGLADRRRDLAQLLVQQAVDPLFDRILREQVVDLHRLLLPVTVDPADPLLHGHGVPGQVVVEQDAPDLEVDAFAAGRRAQEKAGAVLAPEVLHRGNLVLDGAALERRDPLRSEDPPELLGEEGQRVPVLGEDDETFVRILAGEIADGPDQGLEASVRTLGNQLDEPPDGGDLLRDPRLGVEALAGFLVAVQGPARRLGLLLAPLQAPAHPGDVRFGVGVAGCARVLSQDRPRHRQHLVPDAQDLFGEPASAGGPGAGPAGFELQLPACQEDEQASSQRLADRTRARRHDLLEGRHHEADGALPAGRASAGDARGIAHARGVVAFAQVVADALVEHPLPRPEREAFGMHLAAPEDRVAPRVRDLAPGAPDHDAVQQSAVVGDRLGAGEQLVVQELDQRPELEGVALVRRRGEEEQVPAVVAQRLGEAVVPGGRGLLAAAGTRQMVRFVEDHEVPRGGGQQALHPAVLLEGVDGADDARVPLPGRGTVVAEIAAEHVEGQAKAAGQLVAPVLEQPGRRHDQDPGRFAARDQLADEHPRLDGLAQPDLVREEQPPRPPVDQIMDQQDLVGQEVHPAGAQLAAGVGVGEVEGHLPDAVVFGVVEVARRQALPEVRGLLQPFDGQVLHPLAFRCLEQHLGLVDAEGLGHAQHLARAPLRMPPHPDLVVDPDPVDRRRLAHDRLKEARKYSPPCSWTGRMWPKIGRSETRRSPTSNQKSSAWRSLDWKTTCTKPPMRSSSLARAAIVAWMKPATSRGGSPAALSTSSSPTTRIRWPGGKGKTSWRSSRR